MPRYPHVMHGCFLARLCSVEPGNMWGVRPRPPTTIMVPLGTLMLPCYRVFAYVRPSFLSILVRSYTCPQRSNFECCARGWVLCIVTVGQQICISPNTCGGARSPALFSDEIQNPDAPPVSTPNPRPKSALPPDAEEVFAANSDDDGPPSDPDDSDSEDDMEGGMGDLDLAVVGTPMTLHRSTDLGMRNNEVMANVMELEMGPEVEEEAEQHAAHLQGTGEAEYLNESQDGALRELGNPADFESGVPGIWGGGLRMCVCLYVCMCVCVCVCVCVCGGLCSVCHACSSCFNRVCGGVHREGGLNYLEE